MDANFWITVLNIFYLLLKISDINSFKLLFSSGEYSALAKIWRNLFEFGELLNSIKILFICCVYEIKYFDKKIENIARHTNIFLY